MEERTYGIKRGNFELRDLADKLAHFLENNKKIEKVQVLQVPTGYLVQAKESLTSMKNVTGLGKAIQVELIMTESIVIARIGHGEWFKKAAGAFLRKIVFLPLGITGIIGAVGEISLFFECFKFIEKYMTDPDEGLNYLRTVSREDDENIETEATFLMQVEEVFAITGRGIIVMGKIQKGSIHVGDEIEIFKTVKERRKTIVEGIEKYRKALESAHESDEVGLLLKDINREDVNSGTILSTPDTFKQYSNFVAGVNVLGKVHDGKNEVLFEGRHKFDFNLGEKLIGGKIAFGEDEELCMPGDYTFATISLDTKIFACRDLEFYIYTEKGKKIAKAYVDDSPDDEQS